MNPKTARNLIRVGTATRLSRYRPGSVASQADLLQTYWKKKKIRKNRFKPKKKAPPQTQQKQKKLLDFNIFQANVSGISKKREHLKSIMDKKNVHVALLQETQHWSCEITIQGYTEYPCKCKEKGQKCQGIITYIRNDIQGEVSHLDCHPTDTLKSTIWHGNQKLTVYNIYCPPRDTFKFTDPTTTFSKTVLAGDFNGHSPLWGYVDTDNTGKKIEELCNSTNLCLLQDENSPPSLLHRCHGTLHRPDLTLVSGDLENHSSEELLEDISSDHRPILTKISIIKRRIRTKKTRWNFKKAKWDLFRQVSEDRLEKDPPSKDSDVEQINEQVTSNCLDSAQLSIPRGNTANYKPFWNPTLEEAVQARHLARIKYEDNNDPTNRTEYNKKSAEAKLITKKSKQETWSNTCAQLNLKQGGREAWSLLNNLSGENRKENPKPLHLENETLTTDFRKAEHFNKVFAEVSKSGKKTDLDRGLEKILKSKLGTDTDDSNFIKEFTLAELEKQLRKLKKRKSPGPDKVHNEMLINLGPRGKEALLLLVNKTWETGKIPKIWRLAIITPILKKGKSADKPQNYRPISLTSCIGKLCERMINHRLYWWLESTGRISQYQAGFRAKSRTEDQLFRLTQKVLDGFQKEEHTTAVFIDLQQAYDRVWRKGLFFKMQNMGIKGKMYSWVKAFLTDRLIQTRLNDTLSSKTTLEEGLPQGSALSCTLFLIFINDITDNLKCMKALFADDLVIWHSSNSTIIGQRRIQEDLMNLERYCNLWKLKINITKTVYTIFTNSHKVAEKTSISPYLEQHLRKTQILSTLESSLIDK